MSNVTAVYVYSCFILDVVRQSGSICKCYDDFFEDIQISDELRKVRIIVICMCFIRYYLLCRLKWFVWIMYSWLPLYLDICIVHVLDCRGVTISKLHKVEISLICTWSALLQFCVYFTAYVKKWNFKG